MAAFVSTGVLLLTAPPAPTILDVLAVDGDTSFIVKHQGSPIVESLILPTVEYGLPAVVKYASPAFIKFDPPQHHMLTRAQRGVWKLNPKYTLHISASPSVPTGSASTLLDPNSKDVMLA